MVADAARRFGASFRSERVEVADGPNLEARARPGPPRGARPRCGHRPHRRRPGRDGPGQPVAGRRRPRSGRPCGPAPATPCSPCGGPRRWPSARSSAWSRCTTRPTTTRGSCATAIRHELLPLCSAIAGRDVVPVLARQAGVLAGDADILDAVASLVDPEDAAALAAAPAAVARRSVRAWLHRRRRPTRRRSTPSSGCSRWPGRSAGPPRSPVAGGSAGRGGRLSVARGPRPAGHDREARAALRYSRAVITAEETRRPSVDRIARATPTDVGRVIVSEEDLQARIAELGERITADYAGRPPLLVGVLKGAFMFMSDLSRAIDLPVRGGLHGRVLLRQRHPHLGGGPHREGPRRRPGRPARPGGRGHRRQRADPQLPPALPAGPPAGQPRGLRAAGQGRPAAHRARPALRRVSHPGRVRGGIWPRCRRALAQPPGHPRLRRRLVRRAGTADRDDRRHRPHRAGHRRAARRPGRGPGPGRPGQDPGTGWPGCTRSCSPGSARIRPTTSR